MYTCFTSNEHCLYNLHKAIDGLGWSSLCVLPCIPHRQQAHCWMFPQNIFPFHSISLVSVYIAHFDKKLTFAMGILPWLIKEGWHEFFFLFFELFLQQNVSTMARNWMLNLMLDSTTASPLGHHSGYVHLKPEGLALGFKHPSKQMSASLNGQMVAVRKCDTE